MNSILNSNKGRWFMVEHLLLPQMLQTITVAVKANQEDDNQAQNLKA
jgi:hypothetical protein